jgi:hypothetical protein
VQPAKVNGGESRKPGKRGHSKNMLNGQMQHHHFFNLANLLQELFLSSCLTWLVKQFLSYAEPVIFHMSLLYVDENVHRQYIINSFA